MKVTNHQRKKPTFWKRFLEKYVTITMISSNVKRILYIVRIESEITKQRTRTKLHGAIYNTDYTRVNLPMVEADIIEAVEIDETANILIPLANEETEAKRTKEIDYNNVPF